MRELKINDILIKVVVGEPAFQTTDALIHPTNNYLWFSPGGSDNIKRKGGDNLETEALQLGPIEVGQSVITAAGRLKCRYIIHTAAWGQDMITSKQKVRQAVLSALKLATEHRCESVALPPVGVGVGGFDFAQALEATFMGLVEHCLKPSSLHQIIFLAKNPAEEKIMDRMLQSANNAIPPFDHSL